ncbi:MAG: hypothetical protein ACE5R4_10845 [Armatimonadota bacterium]
MRQQLSPAVIVIVIIVVLIILVGIWYFVYGQKETTEAPSTPDMTPGPGGLPTPVPPGGTPSTPSGEAEEEGD